MRVVACHLLLVPLLGHSLTQRFQDDDDKEGDSADEHVGSLTTTWNNTDKLVSFYFFENARQTTAPLTVGYTFEELVHF